MKIITEIEDNFDLREKLNNILSLREFGKICGFHFSYLSKICKGMSIPEKTAEKIKKAYYEYIESL